MRMVIKGAAVFTDAHRFEEKSIYIEEARIVEPDMTAKEENVSANCAEDILDATGLIAIPGLVDIHLHGAAGHDLCDADANGLRAIAEYEASRGVLAICPATMTLSEDHLLKVMDAARRYQEKMDCDAPSDEAADAADLVGIHLEGPFLSEKKLGAQNPAFLAKPDAAMVERLDARSGGMIKIVDIAPELDGAMKFIRELSDRYTISLAHTDACYETAQEAFAAGASHLTHLFNAMPGLHHRDPGPIAAAAEANRTAGLSRPVDAELIADGIHVHPSMVRLAFSFFGADRMILISDSMEATGLPDGSYSLGGLAVTKSGSKAVLSDSPSTIAGSVTDLFSCMREVIRMGIPAEQAVRAASENPARSIGIAADYGSLDPGHYANILLVNQDFELVHIIKKGRLI